MSFAVDDYECRADCIMLWVDLRNRDTTDGRKGVDSSTAGPIGECAVLYQGPSSSWNTCTNSELHDRNRLYVL